MKVFKLHYDGEKFVAEKKATEYGACIDGIVDAQFADYSSAVDAAKAFNEGIEAGDIVVKKCKDCGKYFSLSIDTINWYLDRKLKEPRRCKACIKKNKIKQGNSTVRIKDNPFDVILSTYLEMARMSLWNAIRMGNPECGIDMHYDDNMSAFEERIKEQVRVLKKLEENDKEGLRVCRETSCFHNEKHDVVNNILLNLSRLIPTEYMQAYPVRNLEFEEWNLGKDSEKYKRILELREMASSEEFMDVDERFLYDVIAVVGKEKGAVSNNEVIVKEFAGKHNLTEEDVEYILEYRRSIGRDKGFASDISKSW